MSPVCTLYGAVSSAGVTAGRFGVGIRSSDHAARGGARYGVRGLRLGEREARPSTDAIMFFYKYIVIFFCNV